MSLVKFTQKNTACNSTLPSFLPSQTILGFCTRNAAQNTTKKDDAAAGWNISGGGGGVGGDREYGGMIIIMRLLGRFS